MQPEAVVVRAPLPAVRSLLRPEQLTALVPGLAADAGAGGTLRLWRPGGVSSHGVQLQSAATGEGTLLRSVAGAPVGFRLSLAAVPASGEPPSRCLLEGRVAVEPDGADSRDSAALRHALLRLVPEIAAAVEHAAVEHAAVEHAVGRPAVVERAAAEPAAVERQVQAARPRSTRVAAALAAAAVCGLVAAVVVRRSAGKGRRPA